MRELVLIALCVSTGFGAAMAAVNPAYQTWAKRKQAGHAVAPSTVTVSEAQSPSVRTPLRTVTLSASPKTALATATLQLAAASQQEEEVVLSQMPEPLDTSYLTDVNNILIRAPYEGYPAKWDLRDYSGYNMLSPVKNQKTDGSCWAYSALASLESAAIITGFADQAPDYSESHMVANRLFDYTEAQGGNADIASAYLLRWAGPVNEGDTTDTVMGHVQQVRWIPARQKDFTLDIDHIKEAILRFGPVVAKIDWNESFIHGAAYYYPYLWASANHSVAIVGWDDDYSRDNFAVKPLKNGAFIVKNSLGTGVGDNGYFYVSYYDQCLGFDRMVAFNNVESAANYGTIYQYDEFGCTDKIAGGATSGNCYAANIFAVGEEDDQIAAVGFYALVPGLKYEVTLYTDVNLNAAGSSFSVVVKFSSNASKYLIPLEANIEGATSGITSAPGQSYFSPKGGSWVDVSTKYTGANVCIKAYGIQDSDPGEFIDENRYLSGVELDGPLAVQAGSEGTFTATSVYSDGFRTLNDDITEWTWEVAAGAGAITVTGDKTATLKVAVNPDLTEDTQVVLTATVDDYVAAEPFVKTIAFTASANAPGTPANLKASAGSTTAGVRIEWDEVANAASYSIFRSLDGGSPMFLESVRTAKYTDSTATPGVDYAYTVKAVNGAGSGEAGTAATGWRALAAPATFEASAGAYDYVQLSWAASEGASFYKVYRSADLTSSVPTNLVAVTGWTADLAFRDTPPEKGVDYVYYVTAALDANGTRESDYSVLAFGSRKMPIRLASVDIVGPASVNAGTTTVFRGRATLTNGATYEDIAEFAWQYGTEEPVTNATLSIRPDLVSDNTIATLRLTYTRTDDDGAVTKSVEKQIVILPVVPKVPNAVKVDAAGTDGITLAWGAVEGASGYRLYRLGGAQTAQLLVTTDELTFKDTTAVPGVAYTYAVAALNAAGESAKSEACTETMRTFTPPSYVSASADRKQGVLVTWRSVIGAKFYRVYRSDSRDGEKRALSNWIAEREFTDETARAGVTYWYSVATAGDANGLGESEVSRPTIGQKTAAQTLAYITIDGPSSIQHDSEGAFTCVATYANGVEKRIQPTWSFKSSNQQVSVSSDGVVTAGHVTGSNLALELQASYTEDGVTANDSYSVTVIASVEAVPTVSVSNVTIRARWPWNGMVDITYDLYSSPGTTRAVVSVSGKDKDLDEVINAVTLSGDGIEMPVAGGNPHEQCHTVWNVGADVTNFHSSAFSVVLDVAPYEVAAPVGVRASNGTSTNAVELAWEASYGAVEYIVYRSTINDPASAEEIGRTETADYADTTANAGDTYYYWIETSAGEFESDKSGKTTEAVSGVKALPVPAAADIESDIAAYYPFNGDLDDFSGNRRDLIASNGVSFVSGHSDKAAVLNGTVLASPETLSGSYTFAAWLKADGVTALFPESASGFSVGAAFAVLPKTGFALAMGSNGIGVFDVREKSIPCLLRYEADLGKTWHLVVVSVNANGAPVLFVDGHYVKTGLKTESAMTLSIGEGLGGGEYGNFKGAMDDVVCYARAFTETDAAELFDKGAPAFSGKVRVTTPVITVTDLGAGQCRVEISDSTDGVTIYYSIDRTDGGDTVNNREYSVGFNLTGNATVTAYAVKEGLLASSRVVKEISQQWSLDVSGALGGDGVVYATAGDGCWVADTKVTSDGGVASMRSGDITHGQSSTLTATFAGEGRFTFDWKCSSEPNFDTLTVLLDDAVVTNLSGKVDWTEMTLVITNAGTHVVTWTYAKDAGVSRNDDCGWVDRVDWIPDGTQVEKPSVSIAQDGTRVTTVTVDCATADSTKTVTWTPESGEEQVFDYSEPFTVEGDGTLTVVAKVTGLRDSDPLVYAVRRPWIVRVTEAMVTDEVIRAAVTFDPDYYDYGTDEAYWWDEDKTTVADGGYASIKSPKVADAEKGSLDGNGAGIYATFEGKGTLRFKWKVDSEAGWDVLTYYGGEDYDDYSYGESISGDRDWSDVTITFATAGTHVMEWEYNKDDSGAHGADAGWADTLKWYPAQYAPEAPAAKNGYIFKGYARQGETNVAYQAGETLSWDETAELVEAWEPIRYTVRFVVDSTNDNAVLDQAFTYDVKTNLTSWTDLGVARPVYGWALTPTATSAKYADGKLVSNLTNEQDAVVMLYPIYAKVKVTKANGDVSYSSSLSLSSPVTGAVYEMLQDITTTRLCFGSALAKNRQATLDLGGHTLRFSYSGAAYRGIVFHPNCKGAMLTVRNGKIESPNCDAFSVAANCTLNLESTLSVETTGAGVVVAGANATLNTAAQIVTTGSDFGISGIGTSGYGGTVINVTGGAIISPSVAIYHPQAGSLNVSGGAITGATGVYMKSGNLSVTGGTITGNGPKKDYVYMSSGVSPTGDAVVIDDCGYPGGTPTYSLSGGTLVSTNGAQIGTYTHTAD